MCDTAERMTINSHTCNSGQKRADKMVWVLANGDGWCARIICLILNSSWREKRDTA